MRFIDDNTAKIHIVEDFQIFDVEEAIKMEYAKIVIITFQNVYGIEEKVCLHA